MDYTKDFVYLHTEINLIAMGKLKSVLIRIVAYLWCLTGMLPVPLHATHYIYKQIKLDKGLPTTLNCISSDNRGFVWTGTKFGLGRFDGHELKRYLHHPDDSTSLPGNNIYQILEDTHHRLWILTDMGVARYSYRNDCFVPLRDIEGRPCIARSACLWGDNLLLGGNNRVYVYDRATDTSHVMYELHHETGFDIIRLAVSGSDHLLCCSRWEGIHAINLHTGRINRVPFKDDKEISDMFIDSKQRIWIAPYNQGVRCFTPDGHELATYTTQNSDLSHDIVLCITEREGQIWMGTDGGGINILDVEHNRFSHVKHAPGDKLYSLPTNSINCIYRDHYNNIWMGGVYNGLISMREAAMKTYTDVPFGHPTGLSHNIVISLWQETPRRIWIGTDGGGINRFDPLTETFTHYPTTREDKITSICDFTPGKLLISVFSDGIYLFDPRTGAKTPFTIVNETITDKLTQHGYAVYFHRNTPHTILLLGDHVYVYDLRTHSFSIASEEIKDLIVWGTLQAIASEEERTFLFDSRRIYTLDHATNHLQTLYVAPPEITINSVAYDREKALFWTGTSTGLMSFDPHKGTATPVHTNLFTDIAVVACQSSDQIWIGAESMLFSYDPTKNRFIAYGESDGVTPNEYVPRSQLVIGGQDIYMGGVEGLLYINGDRRANEVISQPELQLSDVILNGRSIHEQMGGKKQDALSVSLNSNILVRIMAKEEDIFRRRQYRYRVEGPDNTYTESRQPDLNMRMLLPGTYRILASCTAKDGSWTPDRLMLKLTVLPPWYQTWWFAVGCAVAIIALLAGLIYKIMHSKVRKLKWAMKEKEEQVYKEKVHFLINISHELRTPLTLICAPLKRLLQSMLPDDARYLPLQAIYRQSQRMKSLINMVLDVRKMEVGETKVQLQPYPLNTWIRQATQDFIIEGEAEQVHIRYLLDETIGQVSFDKGKCETVLNNLLMNALKHSPNYTTITIATERPETKRVRISIADQGCGLGQVNMDKLFQRFYQGEGELGGTGIGLSYSKILVELQGGTIGAFNNADGGATFYFELPERCEAQEIVNGPRAYLNDLMHTDEKNTLLPSTNEQADFNTSTYRILVADDNPEMADFLKHSLEGLFKQVLTAHDGAEALQLARQYLPDLIISDVMMPRMNGYQLCQRLKEDINISHIPVILLTAREDEQSRREGYKNGADDYLAKPFEEETLLELVRNRLKSRERIRQQYLRRGPTPLPEETTFSQADEAFLSKLNRIIQANLNNCNLDIATLCREMNTSRASLYNKMKALTNISANEYINKFRMEKAIQLISTTDMPFTEIAEKTGFTTPSYFSTAFKQYTGETPTQYKKRIRKP